MTQHEAATVAFKVMGLFLIVLLAPLATVMFLTHSSYASGWSTEIAAWAAIGTGVSMMLMFVVGVFLIRQGEAVSARLLAGNDGGNSRGLDRQSAATIAFALLGLALLVHGFTQLIPFAFYTATTMAWEQSGKAPPGANLGFNWGRLIGILLNLAAGAFLFFYSDRVVHIWDRLRSKRYLPVDHAESVSQNP